MNLLVSYDVNTQTKAGEKRLRQVAKICLGFGQRVQDSVFECSISLPDLERFRSKLLKIVDTDEDSLRIYRLHPNRDEVVEVHGRDFYRNLDAPLII